MKAVIPLLALAVAQLIAPAAHAQNVAHASISNIQATLTDLAPDDGIAPSYTYQKANQWTPDTAFRLYYGLPGTENVLHDYAPLPWSSKVAEFDSATLPTPTASHLTASARNPGSSLETLQLIADSSATGSDGLLVAAHTHPTFGMFLSPRTAMTLSFQVDLQGSIGPLSPAEAPGWTSSGATIELRALTPTGEYTQVREQFFRAGDVTNPGTPGLHILTIELSNPHATRMYTSLSIAAIAASVLGNTSPVPEPSTYAMLAAGLGLIGAARRRARRDC